VLDRFTEITDIHLDRPLRLSTTHSDGCVRPALTNPLQGIQPNLMRLYNSHSSEDNSSSNYKQPPRGRVVYSAILHSYLRAPSLPLGGYNDAI